MRPMQVKLVGRVPEMERVVQKKRPRYLHWLLREALLRTVPHHRAKHRKPE